MKVLDTIGEVLSKPGYQLLLVVLLGFVGYSNTFNVPFYFDDAQNIVDNPIIRNLDFYIHPAKAENLKGYPLFINRYAGSLSFALNYKLNGLNVAGFHAVNLLIHLTNSLLVYWLAFLTIGAISPTAGREPSLAGNRVSYVAFFTSLLFVTHPLQTQAVTYIVQRFASLAAMFYLFSVIMYFSARMELAGGEYWEKAKSNRFRLKPTALYLLGLISAILAMKTKEISFTLPVMIVAGEFIFFREGLKRRVLYLFPFLLTMLVIPATLLFVSDLDAAGTNITRLATDMSRADYLFTQFRVVMTYFRLLLLPVNQNLDYDFPVYHSLFKPEVLLSFAVILSLIVINIWLFVSYRKKIALINTVFFGVTWLFVTMSVESSVIPIIDVIFEHRMYLPSMGLFLALSAAMVAVAEKCRSDWRNEVLLISFVSVSLLFTGLTYARNNLWSDRVAFWQDVVSKSPDKARGYTQLGAAYRDLGDLDKAMTYYTRAMELDPTDDLPYSNLGDIYLSRGLIDKSIFYFRKAIAIRPLLARSHYNLGCAYYEKGMIDESIASYKTAIRLYPSYASAHYNLGGAYLKKGLMKEAGMELNIARTLEGMK